MNLTCPSCDTTFRVDPDQLGPAGRRVRCGGCGHDWVQSRAALEETQAGPALAPDNAAGNDRPGTASALDPGASAADGNDAVGDVAAGHDADGHDAAGDDTVALKPPILAAPQDRRRRKAKAASPRAPGSRTAAGWLVFLLVLVILIAGAYFGRAQIVAAVPAAAELYRLAGLPLEPRLGDGLELREIKSVRRLIDGQRVVVIEGLIANISDRPREVPQLRASMTDAAGAEVDQWVFSANAANLPPGGVTQFETSTRNAPREGKLGIDFVAAR